MLTWFVWMAVVVAIGAAALLSLVYVRRRFAAYAQARARRHIVAHSRPATSPTEQHAEELERRLTRLRDTSREQTSTLQDSLEALRAGRRHRREG